MRLSGAQGKALFHFRGTGKFVGKDAQWKAKVPKRGVGLRTLLSLRKKGLLEHMIANQWYLTEAGRDVVYGD
jgi:hypothetical protein